MKSGPIKSARPRGVRAGELYAIGTLVVWRTGGDMDAVAWACVDAKTAKESAESHNRKRRKR